MELDELQQKVYLNALGSRGSRPDRRRPVYGAGHLHVISFLRRLAPVAAHVLRLFSPSVRHVLPMKNRLKVLRAERNWTQRVGRALEVRQTINAIETGKFDPSLRSPSGPRLFGLRIEEIFHDDDRKSCDETNRINALYLPVVFDYAEHSLMFPESRFRQLQSFAPN